VVVTVEDAPSAETDKNVGFHGVLELDSGFAFDFVGTQVYCLHDDCFAEPVLGMRMSSKAVLGTLAEVVMWRNVEVVVVGDVR
jgi:hypothetical protein